MNRSELLATVERLCDIELDTLGRDELADVVGATARVRGWLDTLELRCARQGRTLAEAGRAEPAPALIAHHTNRSSREADQIARRDRVAEAMPTFEAGLDDGVVSAGHLDAIASAVRNAPPEVRAAFAVHEDELLAFATADSIDTFTRRCRALVTELTTEHTGNDATELERQRAASTIRTWVDNTDGLHHTHAALDPLRHEILWTAINRSIRRRQQLDGNARTPWNQIQVDALVDAVTGRTTPVASPAAPTGRTADDPGTGAPRGSARPTADGSGRPADSRTPSPAADIARSLSAAIDRSVGVDELPPAPAPALDLDLRLGLDGSADDRIALAGQPPGRPPDIPPDESRAGLPAEATDAELRLIEQRLPEISVVTELSVLTDGLRAQGICETQDGVPLPVSTMRRLLCDAEVIPVVLSGDGIPLDVGRSSRTVTPTQRRALRALHRTCSNPACPVPFSQTKVHHVRFWTRDNGPTDIDCLTPLCETCHHLVHEGGWTLTMTADRIATWTRPDGTIHYHGPTSDRPPPGSAAAPETPPGPPSDPPPGPPPDLR